jgi:hypothetical protein
MEVPWAVSQCLFHDHGTNQSMFVYTMDSWDVTMGHTGGGSEGRMGSTGKSMAWHQSFPQHSMDTSVAPCDSHSTHHGSLILVYVTKHFMIGLCIS